MPSKLQTKYKKTKTKKIFLVTMHHLIINLIKSTLLLEKKFFLNQLILQLFATGDFSNRYSNIFAPLENDTIRVNIPVSLQKPHSYNKQRSLYIICLIIEHFINFYMFYNFFYNSLLKIYVRVQVMK